MGVHRFPHQAFRHFRAPKDAKKWLSDNYKLLHLNGIIEDWLTEYPDIASRIEEAGLRGQSIKKVKTQEWQIFCNGYAFDSFLPLGIHPRMGDNYTCIAVAKYLHCYRQCTHWIGGSGAFYTLYGWNILHN